MLTVEMILKSFTGFICLILPIICIIATSENKRKNNKDEQTEYTTKKDTNNYINNNFD